MLKATYSFEDLKIGSQLVRDLIQQKDTLKPLISCFFDTDQINDQARNRIFDAAKREILVSSLTDQNQSIDLTESVKNNIQSLREENTFTVTTGHQLNLLTGPLYGIYKIAQCISLSEHLNSKYPDKKFVPVFWMATEDHDFEEINHINLFGSTISWEKADQENVIAGKIKTASMTGFLDEVEQKFQDPAALKEIRKFTNIYRQSENLAQASRELINQLFGSSGLVIVDGDDQQLKALFMDAMVKEVEEGIGLKSVTATNAYLQEHHYHEQVFVRDCNLFFIAPDGTRKRVRKENEQFFIEDEQIEKSDLIKMISTSPEKFSPNALYRPLYQEIVLPNLVYIGGGGEIAYWLQIKALFDNHRVPFPMLRLRDSVLLYKKMQADLMEQHKLDLLDLKLGVDQIIKSIAIQQAAHSLQLTDAEGYLFQAKSKVLEKVYSVNQNLEAMVEAEFAKMIKTLERIESKLIKEEKMKHEQLQNKLLKVREHFFPENSFQERHDNFLTYYLKDDAFLVKILRILAPDKIPQIRTLEI